MVRLVSEKRELYRDKLHLLLQNVTTVPTDDTVQQEVEEDGVVMTLPVMMRMNKLSIFSMMMTVSI